MATITKEASGSFENALKTYLEATADERLAEKINAGEKTFRGCAAYITGEARKQQRENVAIIDDATVYGWAAHYFEEDSIKEAEQKMQATVKKAENPAEKKPETEPKVEPIQTKPRRGLEGQMGIFELLGGEA